MVVNNCGQESIVEKESRAGAAADLYFFLAIPSDTIYSYEYIYIYYTQIIQFWINVAANAHTIVS